MCLYVQHTEIKSFLSKYILFLFLKNRIDYKNFILVKNENLDNRKDTRYSFNNIFLLKNETTKKFKIVIFFYYRKKQLEKFIKANAIDNSFDIKFYYIGEHDYSRKKFIYDGITITIEPFDTETAHAINHLTIYTLFDEVKKNINNSLFKKIMSDYTEKNQPIKNREGKIYYKYKGSNGTYVQELIDGYFTYVSPTKFNDPFDCDLSLISLIYYFPISSSTFYKYCSIDYKFRYCKSYIYSPNLQYNVTKHNLSGSIIYNVIIIYIEHFEKEIAYAIKYLTEDILFDEVKEKMNDSTFKAIINDYFQLDQIITNILDHIFYKYRCSSAKYAQELFDEAKEMMNDYIQLNQIITTRLDQIYYKHRDSIAKYVQELFDVVNNKMTDFPFKEIRNNYIKLNQIITTRLDDVYYEHRDSIAKFLQELFYGYFSYVSPTKFNDPFDCDLSLISLIYYFPISSSTFYKYCSNNSIFKYCESYIGLHNLQYNISSDIEFKFVVFNYKDEFRVLCLTPIMDNIPMWGYYANSHDGVCVGHTLSDYISVTKNNYNGLIIYGDINYSPIRPKYIVFHYMLNNIYLIVQIIKNCFTKYIGWEEEKEFRILTSINGFSQNLINSTQGNDYINLKGTTAELYLGVNYTSNYVLPPFAKQLKKDIYKYKLNV